MGTFCLLNAAKDAWMNGPHQPKQGCEDNRFHHISTDEVYGSSDNDTEFTEESPYRPSSPYSSSKASSDLIALSYHKTYGLNVVVSNASNNYGPRQHAEKLIPTIVRTALAGNHIPIYGQGSNLRDWLHVADHARAVDRIFHHGQEGINTTFVPRLNDEI